MLCILLGAQVLFAQEKPETHRKTWEFTLGGGIQRNTLALDLPVYLVDQYEPAWKFHVRIGATWNVGKKFFLYSGIEWMDKGANPYVSVYLIPPVSSTAPKNYVVNISRLSINNAQIALGAGYRFSAGKFMISPALGILPSLNYRTTTTTRYSDTFDPEPRILKGKQDMPFDRKLFWNGELRITLEHQSTLKKWGLCLFYQHLFKNPDLGVATLNMTQTGVQIFRRF